MRSTKRIGLIGGMSWESTALYYQLINQGVAERLGGLHSADCLLASVDFATVAELQAEDRWDEAGDLLAEKARTLEAAGADLLLLCTNTMHKVAPAIEAAVGIPLLHIIDITADAARSQGLRRLGLLATGFTMGQPFYRDRIGTHGLETIIPDSDDRELVHRIIYDELCRGMVTDDSRQRMRAVIDDLVARGADGVILGCTEIELLIKPGDSPVPVLATTALHAAAAVDAALS
ncbi:aspartate/glutamate racemase family protein [Nocardioides sp. URHA0032]|uniref:aspartate/glutamate racemase family protein n=1 Tax=Nocardioides sp. URHA0032 TaxID=1380388 RepID=UPI00055A3D74|nr:aspartate/glutamate racemase family protein [Nocardioides sp. URHA0032]